MAMHEKIFDEQTIAVNYLVNAFVEEWEGVPYREKKKIVERSVREIFTIMYFEKIPSSVRWRDRKIHEILEEMCQKLIEYDKKKIHPKSTNTIAA